MKKKPLYLQMLRFLFPIVEKFDREVYGKMSDKELLRKWYLPQLAVYCLPVAALGYLFYPLLHPDNTLFSNDGPFGVMNSQWFREGYPPGQANWNDLWWLGNGAGRTPIMITNVIYWIGTSPVACFITLHVLAFTIYYALRNRYLLSLLPYAPEQCEDDIPLNRACTSKHTAVLCHRLLFLTMLSRFAWIYFATLDKPWNVDTVAFPFEGFVWVAYLFLGLVFWLSDEMEHLDYKRTFSERSSK